MNVFFHESESYLLSRVDPPFDNSLDDGEIRWEREKYVGERLIQLEVTSTSILRQESAEGDKLEEKNKNMMTEGEENRG
jgi:hypothetical protein